MAVKARGMCQVRCAIYVVAWERYRHLLPRLPLRQKRNRRRSRESVSEEVWDASRRESEGVCVSWASFALPALPIEGVQRGEAPSTRVWEEPPSPSSSPITRECPPEADRGFGRRLASG